MPVTRALLQQFRFLVTKVFQCANKPPMFMDQIARELKSTLTQTLQSTDPDYIVASYLIAQIQGLGESNSKTDIGLRLIQSFFRALTIPLQPKTEVQFEDLVKNIMETPGQINVVANLWKEGAKTYDCYCGEEDVFVVKDNAEQLCYKCGRCCHTACFWPKQSTQKYFECPVCYITCCIPNKPVDQIFFIGFLKADDRVKVSHKLKFQIDMKKKQGQNVEIRCVRLNQKSRFQMTFPQNCAINIGGNLIHQFIPLSDTSPLKRRNDAQVHINKYELTYLNTLIIKEDHEYLNGSKKRDNHLVAIVSTRPLHNLKQIEREFMNKRLSSENSKLMLQEYMNKHENQCQIQKINVSLQCQYYGTYIKNPARSIQCTTHYQPFDLSNFIHASINSKNSVQKWRCPICKKRAYDLIVDEYLLSLIRSKGNISDICFDRKGEPVLIQKQLQQESEESEMKEGTYRKQNENNIDKQQLNNQVIEIDDNQEQAEERQSIPIQKKNQSNESQNVIEICDSDDERPITENIVKEKRTLSQRQADFLDESQNDKLRKIIPKGVQTLVNYNVTKQIIPQVQRRDDKQRIESQNKCQPSELQIKDRIACLDKIRGRFKQMFASKGEQINKKSEQVKQKSTQKIVQPEKMSIEVSNLPKKTSIKSARSTEMVDVDDPKQFVQVIEDQDQIENKSSQEELRLIQDQRVLLQKARIALKKGPLTKIDQLTFNRICSQINNLKIIN